MVDRQGRPERVFDEEVIVEQLCAGYGMRLVATMHDTGRNQISKVLAKHWQRVSRFWS